MYLASYLVLGIIAGTLGGMLGIGGGVIIVPALIMLFSWQQFPAEMIPLMAVATSLASIIVTSYSAMRAQSKRGAVDWKLFRQWSLLMVAGGFCSGFIAEWIPALVLKRGIAAFLLTVACIMLSQWTPSPERQLPGILGRSITGFMSGLASALAGIGGGNIIVPILVFFNVQMQKASATASALGLPIATVGSLGYIFAGLNNDTGVSSTLGYIYIPAVAAISIGAFLCAPIGVALAYRIPATTLKRLFGGMLLLVSLRLIFG